jgi:hypothetical protein
MSSWLAPAPSTRMRIFFRNRAGTCRSAAASPLMVGERVRAGVPGAEQHGQPLAGADEPGAQRVEAAAFLPGGSRSLLVRAGGDQGGVYAVTTQPVSVFPAISSHGNRAGVSPVAIAARHGRRQLSAYGAVA